MQINDNKAIIKADINHKLLMRRLFFILGLLLATNAIVAQTNYYTESKVFQQNGYTYKVDFASFVKIVNKISSI